MPGLSTRLAMLGLALLVGSCASIDRPGQGALTRPAQRIFQMGYSLVPPNEDGWEISQRDRLLLALGKRGPRTNEVIIVHAAPFALQPFQSDDEFVQAVRERQVKDTDPLRFRIVTHDVTAYAGKGTICAHSHQVLEDHAALTEAGSRVYMVREMLAVTCAHPKNKNVGINVTYSHRYYTGQRDPELLERASRVLNSVEFSDL